MTKKAPDMIHIMLPTEPEPLCVPRVVIERAIARAGFLLTPSVKL